MTGVALYARRQQRRHAGQTGLRREKRVVARSKLRRALEVRYATGVDPLHRPAAAMNHSDRLLQFRVQVNHAACEQAAADKRVRGEPRARLLDGDEVVGQQTFVDVLGARGSFQELAYGPFARQRVEQRICPWAGLERPLPRGFVLGAAVVVGRGAPRLEPGRADERQPA